MAPFHETPANTTAGFPPTDVVRASSDAAKVDRGIHELSELLRALDETATNSGRAHRPPTREENQLVQVRLGIASGLYTALRCKSAGTAAHSLRVALGCSSWTLAMNLPRELRDQIEVAALLHDIGKIGVPDHVLLKPGTLSQDEAAVMDQHREMGLAILGSCAPQSILEIVRYQAAWFDGSRPGYERRGAELPLGARIVSIVNAFDAMTSDHVYRRAMSRERALAELFQHAGTQFDPELVYIFGELHARTSIDLCADASQRWLESLAPDLANHNWKLSTGGQPMSSSLPHPLFQQKLLDNMHDGVVFVDINGRIFLWNAGAERLSGISSDAAYQKQWLPSLVGMVMENGKPVRDDECPLRSALEAGVQSMGRYTIRGRAGKQLSLDLHAIPVAGRDGTKYGATILLHDASNETSLEARCEDLHSQSTKDPLTKVGNRAEFDRVLPLFITAHTEGELPCSLIICDIDHFKSVNDNYGHQAGDEAIKGLAAVLENFARHGDLVARYGGEEFVMLCADCNNAAAASRAEQIRVAFSEVAHPELKGKRITASFGVTENQPGDTAETMLRRADRGLLEAKDTGRNRVVQLGAGSDPPVEGRRTSWWPFGASTPTAPTAPKVSRSVALESNLVTNVPLKLAIEKLRGFVADHDAEILKTGADFVEMVVDGIGTAQKRRQDDRAVPFLIDLKFTQAEAENTSFVKSSNVIKQTRIHVTVRPKRLRDRRTDAAAQRARLLIASLRSYLMAQEESSSGDAAANDSGSTRE